MTIQLLVVSFIMSILLCFPHNISHYGLVFPIHQGTFFQPSLRKPAIILMRAPVTAMVLQIFLK